MEVGRMKCSEAFFLIQRHYDHELALEEQKLLDNHLLTCSDCQQEFEEYGELFGDITLLAQQVEHRDVLSQTLHRLEEAKQKRRIDMWWRGVAVAASIVVIASTAFLTLTNSGKEVRLQVASLMQSNASKTAAAQKAQQDRLRSGTTVVDDAAKAQNAIAKIRQTVPFPLLELQDPALQLVSTSLYGGDDQAMYQMVELEYAVKNKQSGNTDKIYFLATPDASLKAHSKTNIGVYEFHGELQAGAFKWARVGSHALTAEINGDFYQLYSPFLQTNDIAKYAATIKLHR
jgi:hypothetical protein